MKLSTASYCASSAHLPQAKIQVSIMNLCREWIKAPVISDNSHCRFTALLCSDQKSSLKHLVPTVGYLGLLTLANWADQPAVPETVDNWGNKANSTPPPPDPPAPTHSTTNPLSVSLQNSHSQPVAFPTHVHSYKQQSLAHHSESQKSTHQRELSAIINVTQQYQLPQCH